MYQVSALGQQSHNKELWLTNSTWASTENYFPNLSDPKNAHNSSIVCTCLWYLGNTSISTISWLQCHCGYHTLHDWV